MTLKTGEVGVVRNKRRRRYSLYFQSTVNFPSWTSRVRVPSPAPESLTATPKTCTLLHYIKPLSRSLRLWHPNDLRTKNRILQFLRGRSFFAHAALRVHVQGHAAAVPALIG